VNIGRKRAQPDRTFELFLYMIGTIKSFRYREMYAEIMIEISANKHIPIIDKTTVTVEASVLYNSTKIK
jgi:hypothetical protein